MELRGHLLHPVVRLPAVLGRYGRRDTAAGQEGLLRVSLAGVGQRIPSCKGLHMQDDDHGSQAAALGERHPLARVVADDQRPRHGEDQQGPGGPAEEVPGHLQDKEGGPLRHRPAVARRGRPGAPEDLPGPRRERRRRADPRGDPGGHGEPQRAPARGPRGRPAEPRHRRLRQDRLHRVHSVHPDEQGVPEKGRHVGGLQGVRPGRRRVHHSRRARQGLEARGPQPGRADGHGGGPERRREDLVRGVLQHAGEGRVKECRGPLPAVHACMHAPYFPSPQGNTSRQVPCPNRHGRRIFSAFRVPACMLRDGGY
mmetsp:Transcript_23393/g.72878  ORF Transcript_23393/g.72878 Transcript_23393/m.72878 type:complete len:312 (+) Transcript_23393:678-1613(+)